MSLLAFLKLGNGLNYKSALQASFGFHRSRAYASNTFYEQALQLEYRRSRILIVLVG